MRKPIWVLVGIGFLFLCGSRDRPVDMVVEDGVEVVLNHLEPYQLKGEPSTFSLEEVLSVDLERADLATAGLGSGGEWDVDDDGNMFVVGFKNKQNFIYRFDRAGLLTGSFGRRGQGPGELQWPFLSGISRNTQIALTDNGQKLVVYDLNGATLQELRLRRRIHRIDVLGNEKYLASCPRPDLASAGSYVEALTLCDGEFMDLKILDRYERTPDDTKQVPYFMWRISGGRIIIANEARGYEFWVYDFDGNLVRKVRKEYRPVRVTDEIKAAILGPDYRKSGIPQGTYFPDPLPPLNQFFVDDEGRIFAMTYEPGANPDEYIWDIFNPDGVFIGRKALNILWAGLYGGPHYTFIKQGRLYCHREKETGFHELVVYKVTWE